MKIAALLLLISLQFHAFSEDKTEILKTLNGVATGQKAASFGGFDLNNSYKSVGLGRLLKQNEVKGVVLSVFGTYCMACKKGLTLLNQNRDILEKKGIFVILLDYMEKDELVIRFLKANSIGLITLTDTYGEILKAYGLKDQEKNSLPKTFLIDKTQKIVKILGAEGPDLISIIEEAFK